MTKVIVEFEVNTQHVGKGYFERALEMYIDKKDEQGHQQIKFMRVLSEIHGWT